MAVFPSFTSASLVYKTQWAVVGETIHRHFDINYFVGMCTANMIYQRLSSLRYSRGTFNNKTFDLCGRKKFKNTFCRDNDNY